MKTIPVFKASHWRIVQFTPRKLGINIEPWLTSISYYPNTNLTCHLLTYSIQYVTTPVAKNEAIWLDGKSVFLMALSTVFQLFQVNEKAIMKGFVH